MNLKTRQHEDCTNNTIKHSIIKPFSKPKNPDFSQVGVFVHRTYVLTLAYRRQCWRGDILTISGMELRQKSFETECKAQMLTRSVLQLLTTYSVCTSISSGLTRVLKPWLKINLKILNDLRKPFLYKNVLSVNVFCKR